MTLIIFGIVVNRKMKHAREIPEGLQNVAEFYVQTLDGIVKGNMFKHWRKYANYILTIFMFLLLSISRVSSAFVRRPRITVQHWRWR